MDRNFTTSPLVLPPQDQYRHVVRGTVYTVLGTGTLSGPCTAQLDGVGVTIYLSGNGQLLVVPCDGSKPVGGDLEGVDTAQGGKVLGVGILQASTRQDGISNVTIYQGEDGRMWVRSTEEFYDGRFVQVDVSHVSPIS